MLLWVIIVYVTLNFPIFITVFGIVSKQKKGIGFEIVLYGFLKVFKGSIFKRGSFLLIEHTFKKKYYMPVSEIFSMKTTIKPLKDFHILKLKTLTEIGLNGDVFLPCMGISVFKFLNNGICKIINADKPYLKLKNDVNLYENRDCFNVYIKTVVVFNLMMVLLSLIKIIIGKLVYAVKKSKQ